VSGANLTHFGLFAAAIRRSESAGDLRAFRQGRQLLRRADDLCSGLRVGFWSGSRLGTRVEASVKARAKFACHRPAPLSGRAVCIVRAGNPES
jgi:hypothetical protein